MRPSVALYGGWGISVSSTYSRQAKATCTADNDGDGEDLHPLCRLVPIVHKIYESFPKEITLRGKCLE